MAHPDAPVVAPRAFCVDPTMECLDLMGILHKVGRRVRTVSSRNPISITTCMVEEPGDESYVWAVMREHWVPTPCRDTFERDVATLHYIIRKDLDLPIDIACRYS